jgi:hypothetical protein
VLVAGRPSRRSREFPDVPATAEPDDTGTEPRIVGSTGKGNVMEEMTAATLDRQAKMWLQIEGLGAFVAATIAYATLGGDLIWFVPALLLPDLSAIGYLRGPKVGALVYNLVHNAAFGLAVLGAGLALSAAPVVLAGTILVAHIGMDRFAGYGVKLMSGFHDTHLGRKGKQSREAIAEAGLATAAS